MDRFPALAASPPSGLDVRPSIIESSASHLKWMKGLFDIASLSPHPSLLSRRAKRLRLASLHFIKTDKKKEKINTL